MSHPEDRSHADVRVGLIGESIGGSAAETTSRRRSPEASSNHEEEPSVVLDLGNGEFFSSKRPLDDHLGLLNAYFVDRNLSDSSYE